jgi:hypothetical protein
MNIFYRPRFIQYFVTVLASACLLVACANTSRPGVVGVERSQFMMISASQIDRISASSFEQQAKAAQKKNILITIFLDILIFIYGRTIIFQTCCQMALNRTKKNLKTMGGGQKWTVYSLWIFISFWVFRV